MSKTATQLLPMFDDLIWRGDHPRNAVDAKKYGYVYALAPYISAPCVICDKPIQVGEAAVVRKFIKKRHLGNDCSKLAHRMCALRVDRSLVSYAVTRLKEFVNVVF
jgi:hypothetical protein